MEELEQQNQKNKKLDQTTQNWIVGTILSIFGSTIYVLFFRYPIKHHHNIKFADFYRAYTCFKTNEKLYNQADLKIYGKKYDIPDIWSTFSKGQKKDQKFLYGQHKIAFLKPENIDQTPFRSLNTILKQTFENKMYNFRNETPRNLENLWLHNIYTKYTKCVRVGSPDGGDGYALIVDEKVRNFRPTKRIKNVFKVFHPYIVELGNNQYFDIYSAYQENVNLMVYRSAGSRRNNGQNIGPMDADRHVLLQNDVFPKRKQKIAFLTEANEHLAKTKFEKKFPEDGQRDIAVKKIAELKKKGQYLYQTRSTPHFVIYCVQHPIEMIVKPISAIGKRFKDNIIQAKQGFSRSIVGLKTNKAQQLYEHAMNRPKLAGLYNKSVRLSGAAQNMALGSGGQLVTCVLVLNDGLHRFASERKAAAQSDIDFMKNVKQSSIVDPMIFATLYSRYYMMDATEKTTSIGNNVYGAIFNAQEGFKKAYTDPINHSLRRSMDEVGFNHENTYKAGKVVREFVIDFITEEPEQTPGLNERQHSFHLNKESYLQSGVSCTDGRKPVFLNHLDPNNNALGVYKR